MTAEEWRPVPSHPDYDASDLGRIRSRRRRNVRILKPSPCGGYGYLAVCVRTDRGRGKRTATVHSLVAEAFYGTRPEGLEVRHLNGVATDNRAANLQYDTHSENLRDRARHGTDPNARKTRCPKGHPYDEANTFRPPAGGRRCRECNRIRVRAHNLRKRLAAAGLAA